MQWGKINLKNTFLTKKFTYKFLSINMALLILLTQVTYAIDIKSDAVMPKIISLQIYSDNTDTYRAYQGDTVSIFFTLDEEEEIPVDSLEVIFDGQTADVFTFGYGSYIADIIIDDKSPTIGYGTLEVNYLLPDGSKVLLADKTTDGKDIFLSDKTNLIEMPFVDVDIFNKVGEDLSEKEFNSVCNLFDNNINTYSEVDLEGDGKNSNIIFDFKSTGVNLSRVEILSRQDEYYSRVYGVKVSVSYDGKSWSKVSTSNASASNKWQTLTITRNKTYRYVMLSSTSPWYGNLSEVKFYTNNKMDTEVTIPNITDVSLTNNGESNKRALPGDIVTLTFKSDIDLKYYRCLYKILMLGQYPEVKKIGDNTYEASIIVPKNVPFNQLAFDIGFIYQSGKSEYLSDAATDGSSVFVTNDDDNINLLSGDIDFIDYTGTNNSGTLENICNLIDNDENTTSDFSCSDTGEDPSFTLDFKDDTISLSRIELLPRQDELYESLESLDVLGSDDGENWESILMTYPTDTNTWQALKLYNSSYRYIKVTNPNNIQLSELKFFGLKDVTSYYDRFVNIGSKGIYNPESLSKGLEWSGSRVYYGEKNNSSLLWRVLEKEDDDSLFLFSENILETNKSYNHAYINTNWENSLMRAYLNNYEFWGGEAYPDVYYDYRNDGFINKYFSVKEASAIKTTHITTKDSANGTYGGDDTDDKIFCLAIEEAINPYYGFTSNASRSSADGSATETWWWLRNPGTYSGAYIAVIDASGELNTSGRSVTYKYSNERGVRPAFKINGDSILFNTYTEVSKNKYSDFGSVESKVQSEPVLIGNHKLTLKGTDESLDASSITKTTLIQGNDMSINLSHKPASILSEDAQVSAMLVDDHDNVIYYGKVNDDSTSMSSKIELPSTLNSGKYTLKVFAESINDDNFTDFGTEFSNIDITITSGIPVEDIVVNPEESSTDRTIILDGYVTPDKASFKKITYYIKNDGDTEATLDNNILTFKNSGTIEMFAVVKNGQLYGNSYVKEFSVDAVIDDTELPPETTPPDVSPPVENPPGTDNPDVDVPDVTPPDVEEPDTEKPGDDTTDEDIPPDVDIPDTPDEDVPEVTPPDIEEPDIEKPGDDVTEDDIPPDMNSPGVDVPDTPDENVPEVTPPDTAEPDIQKTEDNTTDSDVSNADNPSVHIPDTYDMDIPKVNDFDSHLTNDDVSIEHSDNGEPVESKVIVNNNSVDKRIIFIIFISSIITLSITQLKKKPK